MALATSLSWKCKATDRESFADPVTFRLVVGWSVCRLGSDFKYLNNHRPQTQITHRLIGPHKMVLYCFHIRTTSRLILYWHFLMTMLWDLMQTLKCLHHRYIVSLYWRQRRCAFSPIRILPGAYAKNSLFVARFTCWLCARHLEKKEGTLRHWILLWWSLLWCQLYWSQWEMHGETH